ncbi:MAG: acetyltransferase [Proteobacteria bacterium]|nr:MAG: acetyltransferase [Pseudomonadota bacterium]
MNKQKVIIVGTGETADIAYEYFIHDGLVEVVAFSINAKYKTNDTYLELPLVAIEDLLKIYPSEDYMVFVAISSGKLNRNRQYVYEQIKSLGYRCISYISPKAFVWRTAKIGENCFIFENNVIQHGVEIGNNVILWSGNHIGHQTKIRDNVFISSHCVISGYCDIGENSFLGVNATFADHVKVERDCFIGMGSVISKNIPENSLVVPARSEIVKIKTARQICKVLD